MSNTNPAKNFKRFRPAFLKLHYFSIPAHKLVDGFILRYLLPHGLNLHPKGRSTRSGARILQSMTAFSPTGLILLRSNSPGQGSKIQVRIEL